jgi:hypothetical protein
MQPNTYTELRCDERPVIAKIHGAVSRDAEDRDSFVVTENHYIAYLSHSDITKLIPINIAQRMRRSHFLFLGYSLKDWNLRVILHRLWGDEGLTYNSWAIQPRPERIEEKAWYRRGVELLDAGLVDYAAQLERSLEAGGRGAATGRSADMTDVVAPSSDARPAVDRLPDCPYKGLQAYTEEDGNYFFGRDADSDLVIANLMASRLTLLYGPSGVGKSSLLQAGVVRHLHRLAEGQFSYWPSGGPWSSTSRPGATTRSTGSERRCSPRRDGRAWARAAGQSRPARCRSR